MRRTPLWARRADTGAIEPPLTEPPLAAGGDAPGEAQAQVVERLEQGGGACVDLRSFVLEVERVAARVGAAG